MTVIGKKPYNPPLGERLYHMGMLLVREPETGAMHIVDGKSFDCTTCGNPNCYGSFAARQTVPPMQLEVAVNQGVDSEGMIFDDDGMC